MNEPCPHHEPADSHSASTRQPVRQPYKTIIALVLYVLGTGPASWLELKVPWTGPVLHLLYLPIGVVCQLFPPAGIALWWYLEVVCRIPIDI